MKLTVFFIAVLAIYVLQSEGMIRKCFPLGLLSSSTSVNTAPPTTQAPTTQKATTQAPVTAAPTTQKPTTQAPVTAAPTTQAPTSAPTTQPPTTQKPTTQAATTQKPTTQAPTTQAPTAAPVTTQAPTTQAGPLKQCALWMPYLNDNSPETNGYSAGTNWKNTTSWIGRGWYNGEFIAGRVDVANKTLYVTYFGEKPLTTETEYLVLPSGCSCSWMAPAIAKTHEGMIRVSDTGKHWVVGRVHVGNSVAISKVKPSDWTQWWSTSGSETNDNATEVLVCETTGDNSAPPTVTYTNLVCAGWRTYLNDNAPATNGYKVTDGLSWNNKTMYIGRAHGGGEFCPGRVQLESPAGVYISYFGETYQTAETEYLVLPKNCACTWVDPTAALTRVGIVRVPDPNRHYVVGLKTIGTGLRGIAKVDSVTKKEWYVTATGSETNDLALEKLLVCEKTV